MNTIKRLIGIIFMILIIYLTGCSDDKMSISPKLISGKEATFFITTDIHYLAKELRDDGQAFNNYIKSGDGKEFTYMDELINAFIYDVEKKKPEVLIISGDLTNNGEKKSHEELAENLKKIENMGTSVYVIPGNHDILNPWARGFKEDKQYVVPSVSEKEFSKIYKSFGYDEAISRDKNTLSYLAAPSEDIWLLMLDTNYYKNNRQNGFPQVDGEISYDTYKWIKYCSDLAKEKHARVITVMHHNLLHHSDIIREGYTINDNERVIEAFDKNGLDLVLSGHIHIQDISERKKLVAENGNEGEKSIYDIVTSSLSVYPQQYGILKYSPSVKALDYSTAWVDVEGWSKEMGITDKNLNDYKKYSKATFGKKAYDMVYRRLEGSTSYTDEEKKLMAEVMEILNLNYFAGIENSSKELLNSKGYNLLINDKSGFLSRYALSTTKKEEIDDNKLHVEIELK